MTSGFRDGFRASLPLAVPTGLLGVTFGATAVASGWPPAAPIVASVVIFSGSAQFALLTVLASGGGVAMAVGSAALFNARFVPMGVALGPSLRGGRMRRAVEGMTNVDGSWVIAHEGDGRFDRHKLFGATTAQLVAWISGTVVGVVAAPPQNMFHDFGLDVIYPAFFLVLLLEELREGGGSWRVAVASAALAAALLWVVSPGVTLLLCAAAALTGLRG
jgi:predicted branched-subunit amino acid permease